MLIIQNGTLITPSGEWRADLAAEDGVITRIEERITPAPGDEVLDAEGCLVFPGFIDAHTHLDMDNGVTVTVDDFDTGTAAALVGGTTTLIDFATQSRGGTLGEALKAWHEKADGKAHCDYGFHMAITDWNEEVRSELDTMVAEGITSFKLYMAYDALRVDDAQLLDILREMKRIRGLLGVHCENGTLVNAMVQKLREAGNLDPDAHPRSRPAEVEAEAISRLLYISRLADWPVNVVHLSSALGLQEIRKARAAGQKVLVETCPQYLLLDDSRLSEPDFEGAKYVCSPPLRKPADCAALREALRGGEIDTVATDHCSYNFHGQKELGLHDFSKIPNGLPGVEHRPALMDALVVKGILAPEAMGKLLSENPAREYGLYPRKGALRVGSDADIVIWQRGDFGTITAEKQRQNVDYTPFEGIPVTGRAREVLLHGKVAARQGELIRPGQGRYLKRGRPEL